MMYAHGHGVPKDYEKARQWYERAAAQGDMTAQYNLGLLYADGVGVPQDYKKARQLWEQAAAQGDAKAQNNLGSMYENGEGVPQDYVLAYMWYSLAVEHWTDNPQKFAADNRVRVAGRMTPAQIAEAQTLAREWAPKSK